jgi:hypothetical protein
VSDARDIDKQDAALRIQFGDLDPILRVSARRHEKQGYHDAPHFFSPVVASDQL